MLPYRVYLPQELEAMSSLKPVTAADAGPPPSDDPTDAGPGATGGLRTLPAVLSRLVGRSRLRRPAPEAI